MAEFQTEKLKADMKCGLKKHVYVSLGWPWSESEPEPLREISEDTIFVRLEFGGHRCRINVRITPPTQRHKTSRGTARTRTTGDS